jgi:hypothetical protein
VQHADALDRTMRTLYPIYAFGSAAMGAPCRCCLCRHRAAPRRALRPDHVPELIRIVTMNRGAGAAKKARIHASGACRGVQHVCRAAPQEFRRFTASPTYMLNCASVS